MFSRLNWSYRIERTMKQLSEHTSLFPFVKEIILLESDEIDLEKKFPFYANGFPGIIYSKSTNPFYLQPRDKKLSEFYLYGQTLEPISIDIKGAFQLIDIRLYPFAVRILLGVDPKVLNDDCFDLKQVKDVDTHKTLIKLNETSNTDDIIEIIADYFDELLQIASINPDYRIKLATNLILSSNGTISVKEIRDRLFVTERTLERHFLQEMGVTVKQFAKIIQFSSSMNQITKSDYDSLTEIGFDNGFADQSHFIRTFKKFTGKTPKEFQKQLSF